MALGISERMLQRALSPIDLSYAYEKVDYLTKQLAAQDAAEKREAAKQYYADLAALNKERAGVRAIDVPEVSTMYKEWADIERKLANNPNLINSNPTLYGELKNKSDEVYSKLNTVIRGSKELAKTEIQDFQEMANPQKMDYYMDGAASIYKQNVINKPFSEVIKTGANDRTKYYEQKIDARPFYSELGQRIESQATGDHKILDTTFKGAPGEIREIEFKKMPMLGEIQAVVTDNLYGKMGKNATKFATQQIGDAMTSGDYNVVKKAYNDFYRDDNPNGYKKYFDKPQPKVPLFEGDLTPTQMFVNYTTAREFLSKLPQGVAGKAYFETPSAGMRFRESIRKVDGAGGETDTSFIDAYTNMADYLSQPKAKEGTSLDRFNANAQRIALSTARDITGIKELSNRDVYAKLDPNTGDISLLSMRDITEGEGSQKRTLYSRGQKIGNISGEEVNIAASKVLGVKGVRGAKEAGVQKPTSPVIFESQIKKFASEAGYTPEEYKAELIKRGIKIKKG